jgi:uncharacterized protein
MDLPLFRKIEISDRQKVIDILKASDYQGAEYCFTSLFSWAPLYNSSIAFFNDFLLIRSVSEDSVVYNFPPGNGNLEHAINAILEDSTNFPNKEFKLLLEQSKISELDSLFPNLFEYKSSRDLYDYIYDRESFDSLAGKKYQHKRNHISFFKANYSWTYEKIDYKDPEAALVKIGLCKEMNKKWCVMYGCGQDPSLAMETCSVERILSNFLELQLKGGILKVDDQVVAYTIGEELNSDTYIVHIEKAFSSIRGAYPFINQLFVQNQMSDFKYINREDDAGDEGLRSAKLSYRPTYLIEKFYAIKK